MAVIMLEKNLVLLATNFCLLCLIRIRLRLWRYICATGWWSDCRRCRRSGCGGSGSGHLRSGRVGLPYNFRCCDFTGRMNSARIDIAIIFFVLLQLNLYLALLRNMLRGDGRPTVNFCKTPLHGDNQNVLWIADVWFQIQIKLAIINLILEWQL